MLSIIWSFVLIHLKWQYSAILVYRRNLKLLLSRTFFLYLGKPLEKFNLMESL